MLYNNTNYKQFLLDLDKQRNRTIYARITALRFDEAPIETIEGRVTQGSISLDGGSAVRRTCSLTIVANEFNYSNYLWGLNTKFKLEIGLKNNINAAYPEIIWFNQGIYVISSFNMSRATSNFTISIQGKDKMCQLNGDLSGTISSAVNFDTIQEVDENGVIHIIKIPVKDIIRNIIHQYAGEPLHNIIINDIEDYGLELLEYRYDVPMYLYRKINSSIFDNILIDGKKKCYIVSKNEDGQETLTLTTLEELDANHLDTLTNNLDNIMPSKIKFEDDDDLYYIAKIEFGDTAGYRKTELTYPGDLIGNTGETITSILDKIKNMLGDFEYFYDLDGRFVFQRKQSFASAPWSPIVDSKYNEKYVESLALATANTYNFTNGELISAFNNNPNLMNVKNDYSIWGERTGVSGAKILVHMRYAIDKKPSYYKTITVANDHSDLVRYNSINNLAVTGQVGQEYSIDNYDWREIIYYMAKDFYKYGHMLNDFNLKIIDANSNYYPTGQTGYEQYYMDILTQWRELYDPNIHQDYENAKKAANDAPDNKELAAKAEALEIKSQQYYDNTNGEKAYWNKNVYEHPELLNFWFDFLDTEGELSQFNVKSIGMRTKVVNDTNIKSIYFRETPGLIFTTQQESDAAQISGYKSIQITDKSMFTISAQGQSAKDKLDALMYQHSYCAETATITSIPIYYLQPNTRVYVHDDQTQLDGEYIINKISIPLTYNGTMSLTVTKAAETLY